MFRFDCLNFMFPWCIYFQYLGVVRGVSWETDTTNRTEVLKIIDRGKVTKEHLQLYNNTVTSLYVQIGTCQTYNLCLPEYVDIHTYNVFSVF